MEGAVSGSGPCGLLLCTTPRPLGALTLTLTRALLGTFEEEACTILFLSLSVSLNHKPEN